VNFSKATPSILAQLKILLGMQFVFHHVKMVDALPLDSVLATQAGPDLPAQQVSTIYSVMKLGLLVLAIFDP